MKKFLNIALLPIGKNPGFYFSLILLFGISIIPIEYGRCSRMPSGFEMFGDIYILCAIVTLLPHKIRSLSKYIIFGFLYFVGLADMISYQEMGIALVPNIVQTWLQTNIDEATEALRIHLRSRLLLSPVVFFLILPFLVYTIKKRLNKVTLQHHAALFMLLLTCASIVYGIPNKQYLYEVYTRVSDDDMEEMIEAESMTHEYLPVYRLGLSIKEISRFSKMRQHLIDNVRGTQVDSCSFESPLIVLIIGESYNRHHASLYGYPLPTTPRQDKLHREGKLYRFNDVIASYNLTFKSLENMLTLYDYDAKGSWYDYPIVPALFRKAGYEVLFFSNQNTLDKASAFTDYMEDMFMNNPDISSYMFDLRNSKSHEYDMDLLDDYMSMADTTANNPQLVIFHFIGLHADFKLRYPESQTMFTPSHYSRADLGKEEKTILADYDNAILYNDKVVDAILKVFSDKDAIAIYVPDHGELVYDGCQEMGRNLKHQRKYIEPQFDIPFWIYCSDVYKQNHPDICLEIEESQNRPFMTDDLPHLLLYLGGISCKGFLPERNLIDKQFNVKRKRRIKGEVDYDVIENAKRIERQFRTGENPEPDGTGSGHKG